MSEPILSKCKNKFAERFLAQSLNNFPPQQQQQQQQATAAVRRRKSTPCVCQRCSRLSLTEATKSSDRLGQKMFEQLIKCGRKPERLLVPDLATEWFRKQKILYDTVTDEERKQPIEPEELENVSLPIVCDSSRSRLQHSVQYLDYCHERRRRRLLLQRQRQQRRNGDPICHCEDPPKWPQFPMQPPLTSEKPKSKTLQEPQTIHNLITVCASQLDGCKRKSPRTAAGCCGGCKKSMYPHRVCSCVQRQRLRHQRCFGGNFQADGQPMAEECVAALRQESSSLPRLRRKYNLREMRQQRRLDPACFRRISPQFYKLLMHYEDGMTEKFPLYGMPQRYWAKTLPCCPCETPQPPPQCEPRLGDQPSSEPNKRRHKHHRHQLPHVPCTEDCHNEDCTNELCAEKLRKNLSENLGGCDEHTCLHYRQDYPSTVAVPRRESLALSPEATPHRESTDHQQRRNSAAAVSFVGQMLSQDFVGAFPKRTCAHMPKGFASPKTKENEQKQEQQPQPQTQHRTIICRGGFSYQPKPYKHRRTDKQRGVREQDNAAHRVDRRKGVLGCIAGLCKRAFNPGRHLLYNFSTNIRQHSRLELTEPGTHHVKPVKTQFTLVDAAQTHNYQHYKADNNKNDADDIASGSHTAKPDNAQFTNGLGQGEFKTSADLNQGTKSDKSYDSQPEFKSDIQVKQHVRHDSPRSQSKRVKDEIPRQSNLNQGTKSDRSNDWKPVFKSDIELKQYVRHNSPRSHSKQGEQEMPRQSVLHERTKTDRSYSRQPGFKPDVEAKPRSKSQRVEQPMPEQSDGTITDSKAKFCKVIRQVARDLDEKEGYDSVLDTPDSCELRGGLTPANSKANMRLKSNERQTRVSNRRSLALVSDYQQLMRTIERKRPKTPTDKRSKVTNVERKSTKLARLHKQASNVPTRSRSLPPSASSKRSSPTYEFETPHSVSRSKKSANRVKYAVEDTAESHSTSEFSAESASSSKRVDMPINEDKKQSKAVIKRPAVADEFTRKAKREEKSTNWQNPQRSQITNWEEEQPHSSNWKAQRETEIAQTSQAANISREEKKEMSQTSKQESGMPLKTKRFQSLSSIGVAWRMPRQSTLSNMTHRFTPRPLKMSSVRLARKSPRQEIVLQPSNVTGYPTGSVLTRIKSDQSMGSSSQRRFTNTVSMDSIQCGEERLNKITRYSYQSQQSKPLPADPPDLPQQTEQTLPTFFFSCKPPLNKKLIRQREAMAAKEQATKPRSYIVERAKKQLSLLTRRPARRLLRSFMPVPQLLEQSQHWQRIQRMSKPSESQANYPEPAEEQEREKEQGQQQELKNQQEQEWDSSQMELERDLRREQGREQGQERERDQKREQQRELGGERKQRRKLANRTDRLDPRLRIPEANLKRRPRSRSGCDTLFQEPQPQLSWDSLDNQHAISYHREHNRPLDALRPTEDPQKLGGNGKVQDRPLTSLNNHHVINYQREDNRTYGAFRPAEEPQKLGGNEKVQDPHAQLRLTCQDNQHAISYQRAHNRTYGAFRPAEEPQQLRGTEKDLALTKFPAVKSLQSTGAIVGLPAFTDPYGYVPPKNRVSPTTNKDGELITHSGESCHRKCFHYGDPTINRPCAALSSILKPTSRQLKTGRHISFEGTQQPLINFGYENSLHNGVYAGTCACPSLGMRVPQRRAAVDLTQNLTGTWKPTPQVKQQLPEDQQPRMREFKPPEPSLFAVPVTTRRETELYRPEVAKRAKRLPLRSVDVNADAIPFDDSNLPTNSQLLSNPADYRRHRKPQQNVRLLPPPVSLVSELEFNTFYAKTRTIEPGEVREVGGSGGMLCPPTVKLNQMEHMRLQRNLRDMRAIRTEADCRLGRNTSTPTARISYAGTTTTAKKWKFPPGARVSQGGNYRLTTQEELQQISRRSPYDCIDRTEVDYYPRRRCFLRRMPEEPVVIGPTHEALREQQMLQQHLPVLFYGR